MTATLFSYGSSAGELLTDRHGNVLTDWPISVLDPETGQPLADLVDDDGQPISALRSGTNGRWAFKTAAARATYSYADPDGTAWQWDQVSQDAILHVQQLWMTLVGGTLEGDLTVNGLLTEPGVYPVAPTGAVNGPAIQAAIEAAHGYGAGAVVRLLPGEHQITATLRMLADVTLSGYGATIRNVGTDCHNMLVNGYAGEVFPRYTGPGNIVIEGVTFNHNADNGDGLGTETRGGDVIGIGHATNVTIRDVTVIDTAGAHALELNACSGATVQGCRFLGFYNVNHDTDPGKDFSEAIELDSATATGWIVQPQDNTACEHITIEDCYTGVSDRLGAFGALVGTHAVVDPRWHADIRVVGNTAVGTVSEAIHAWGWRDSIIAGNQIINCGKGIRLDHGNTTAVIGRLVVTGNIITNVGTNGVQVVSDPNGRNIEGLLVSANSIDVTVNGAGIQLVNVDACQVVDNYVRGAVGSGVSLLNCPAAVITRNQLVDSTVSGVKINTGCARGAVRNNRVRSSVAGSNAITCTSDLFFVEGNDAGGNGWDATAFTLDPTTVTTFDGGTAVPGSNYVS